VNGAPNTQIADSIASADSIDALLRRGARAGEPQNGASGGGEGGASEPPLQQRRRRGSRPMTAESERDFIASLREGQMADLVNRSATKPPRSAAGLPPLQPTGRLR
jgi:hypothetical protein